MLRLIKFLIFISVIFLCQNVYAVDHYASPSGTDTWANSVSSSTPCSIQTGFANAVSGDTLYLRGGTYTVTSPLTSPSAHDGTESERVIITNYPGESPIVTGTNLDGTIMIESDYWTVDGIEISMTNIPSADHGVITFGDSYSSTYGILSNCTVRIYSEQGRDNISCVRLQGERANYCRVYNNNIIAHWTSDTQSSYGVQFLGVPGARGCKVYNNEISNGGGGIYFKHNNANGVLADNGELYNNYIHDHTSIFGGTAGYGPGFWGNMQYYRIYNNLLVNCTMDLGMNGGGTEGGDNLIYHNTVYNRYLELWSPSGVDFDNNTITDNIFATARALYGTTSTTNTFDYNMWGANTAIGAHGLSNTSPTYVGGGSPSSISDYALTSGSAGYQGGSDSYDIGCSDVSAVGIQAEDTTAPTVTGVEITYSGDVVISFSETIVSTGYGSGDFNIDCVTAGNDISLSSPSGTGSSRTFSKATTVYGEDTCNLDFVGSSGSITDSQDNDLATFSDSEVTNNAASQDPQNNVVDGATLTGITLQ